MASDESLDALRARIDAILDRPPSQDSGRPRRSAAKYANTTRDAPSRDERDLGGGDYGSADVAFKRAIKLLNASEKSEHMVRSRLKDLGFTSSAIEGAIGRAKDYGFIDDIRYGEVLVRSRVSQLRGSAGIERELAESGIDPYSIPGYPEEYELDPDSEFKRALTLLERKPPRAKNARDAAYRKLVQRGFPSAIASSAARVWHESESGRDR